MIGNLKIGCTVSKDQVIRILSEDIDLDEIDIEKWIIEYEHDGEVVREEFDNKASACSRYNELISLEEFDVMKDLLSRIHNWPPCRGVTKNG